MEGVSLSGREIEMVEMTPESGIAKLLHDGAEAGRTLGEGGAGVVVVEMGAVD